MGLCLCHRCLHGNRPNARFCAICGRRLPETPRRIGVSEPPSHPPLLSVISLTTFACLLLRAPTSALGPSADSPPPGEHGLIYDLPADLPPVPLDSER